MSSHVVAQHRDQVRWDGHVAGTGLTLGDGLSVATTAVQFADGGVGEGTIAEEPPIVCVFEIPMTSAQARELATVLTAAADEVDGWVQR